MGVFMIINVSRNDLFSNVASLQNVTSKKGTIAILANILIETGIDSIILTATDLEVGIRIEIPAEILTAGSITLPSRKFFEMIREINDEHVHLEVYENKWAKISTSSGSYNIAGTDSEEYPSLPEFKNDILSSISCDILAEAIDKTIFSIAQENDNQFNLMGILFEKEVREEKNYLRLVSSDGHRLSLFEREIDTDVSKMIIDNVVLIPKKGISEIRKICDHNDFVEIGFENKQVIVKANKTIIIIRLLNGEFPNYRNIFKSINKNNFIEIHRMNFISSMKRINLFTEDLYNSVHFSFVNNNLILTSQNMDIGNAKEELPIKYDGEPLNLGFNGKYFVEALQVMTSEKIKAYINSEKSPCLIEGDDDPGFMSIIMPMKI
jgi:DNA polymerase-3 subunit beta